MKKRIKELRKEIAQLRADFKNGHTVDGEKMLDYEYYETLAALENELSELQEELGE